MTTKKILAAFKALTKHEQREILAALGLGTAESPPDVVARMDAAFGMSPPPEVKRIGHSVHFPAMSASTARQVYGKKPR